MQSNILPLGGCKRTKDSQIPGASGLKFPQNMILVNLSGEEKNIEQASK
jgi:hypothetical protein